MPLKLTAEQEQEWNSCMLLGLIQALYQTRQLTEAQLQTLLEHRRFSGLMQDN